VTILTLEILTLEKNIRENFFFVGESFLFSEIGIFIKNGKFGQNKTKNEIWRKIRILVNSRNCDQKSKICPKIENLLKNRKFVQKAKFCSKIENFLKF